MRLKGVWALVLTVFFLSLPFACGLFRKKEPAVSAYTVQKDITVNVLDGELTEEKSLGECIYRQIVAEGSYLAEDEAVKAIACAIFSDMLYDRNFTKETHPDAFLCTDCAVCNAIPEPEALPEAERNRILALVSEVIGTAVFYDGQAIIGARTSVSAGATETALELTGKEIKYLVSKNSSWDTKYPEYVSTLDIPLSDLRKKAVLLWGCDGDEIEITEKTSVGAVKKIKVFGKEVSGKEFCEKLGLPSLNFTFEIKDGVAKFKAFGRGTGLGLSEYGADCLAKQGYKYDEILKYYYSGVTVKVADESCFS